MLKTKIEKTDCIFLQRMRNRIKQGYSPIVLFVGEQRSGKTWTAITYAELLDPNFDVEKQLVTNVENFAKVLSESNKKVIVLDEAGVSLDPMRSAEITQRCYSHIIQSQAVRQNICFLVLPCASDFGRTHKVHIDSVVEIKGHNKNGVRAKFYGLRHWRANPNDVNLKTMLIQYLWGIPSPSDVNRKKYMDTKQMTDKDSILKEELIKLEMNREKEIYRKKYYQLKKTKKVEKPKPKVQTV